MNQQLHCHFNVIRKHGDTHDNALDLLESRNHRQHCSHDEVHLYVNETNYLECIMPRGDRDKRAYISPFCVQWKSAMNSKRLIVDLNFTLQRSDFFELVGSWDDCPEYEVCTYTIGDCKGADVNTNGRRLGARWVCSENIGNVPIMMIFMSLYHQHAPARHMLRAADTTNKCPIEANINWRIVQRSQWRSLTSDKSYTQTTHLLGLE